MIEVISIEAAMFTGVHIVLILMKAIPIDRPKAGADVSAQTTADT